MYKNIKNEKLNTQILNSTLFNKLGYNYESCFFLEILIRKTKDDKGVFCNYGKYTDYGYKPKTSDYEKEMDEFITFLNSNKEFFLGHLELDIVTDAIDTNTNIEIIIECSEAYEGTEGLLIVII